MRNAAMSQSPIGKGGAALRGAGLAIEERPWTPILHLEVARPNAAALLGLATLPRPGAAARPGNAVMLPTGPDIYLLLGEHPAASAIAAAFDVALDTSDAWTRLGFAGANAARLLAKGSALDLHPKHFPVDACAAAGFARLRSVLWKNEETGYELLIARSHARSLWEWLIDATEEYGCVSNNGTGES